MNPTLPSRCTARYLRFIAIVIIGLIIFVSEAHAAGDEEAVKTWVVAIFTIVGGGWIWRRSFKAADLYEIWYGTNRRERIANTFDNNFGTEIHYGRCLVSIPQGHVFGSIGSSPFTRWLQRLVSGTDDKLKVVKLTPLSVTAFEKGIGLQLQKFDPSERTVLIFIHGYNVKFSDAAVRAAQIGFDLKVPGLMALYSWPPPDRDCSVRQIKTAKQPPRREVDDRHARATKPGGNRASR